MAVRQRKGRGAVFGAFKGKNEINTTQIVDEIENAVYAHMKPFGFKKHGRTLHRFVSEDISQVIHFQSGMPAKDMGGLFCVNLGIRIPECSGRSFQPKVEKKKYYHEYECTIRSRLGTVSGQREAWYDLSRKTDAIIQHMIAEIDQYVLPAYAILSSREAILAHRRDYPLLDQLERRLILLDECMIYGRRGDIENARERFERHYASAVAEYQDRMTNGRKLYLKKGERAVFMGQDITAEQDSYVTLYSANRGHIDYLDQLAVQLGLR